MKDLSILIPSRNEMFLKNTVDGILANIEADTEVIVVLDGSWPIEPLPQHERLKMIFNPISVGQRAATNQAARIASGKYVMKADAHLAFDKGFDIKLLRDIEPDMTMIPVMRNLHAFDWVCQKCGRRWYQGPTPKHCFKDYDAKKKNDECDNTTDFRRDIIWEPKKSPNSKTFVFDTDLHFQYWRELAKRPESKGPLIETMSIQGSCFMISRERYFELDICDEKHGSWGQQGVEVACKSWLSGGRVVCNTNTWDAHMFRTQGGDFGFPYPNKPADQEKAREYSRDLWFNNKFEKQIYPLSWLLEKFGPVKYWDTPVYKNGASESEKAKMDKERKEALQRVKEAGEAFYKRKNKPAAQVQPRIPEKDRKTIIFYTDNQLNVKLAKKIQNQLENVGLPIVSASLKPMNFGKNVHLPLKRGYMTMAKQILAALEAAETDIVFFAEHDVLYHPSHFDFVPEKKDVYYYNTNVWRVRLSDGHALWTDDLQQLSGLCAYRETLIKHYKERIRRMEEGIDFYGEEGKPYHSCAIDECKHFASHVRAMGFEPGTHNRKERIDDLKAENWQSEFPNIDIRHENNLTPSRWRKDQFKNERYTRGWKESTIDKLPGWENLGLIK